MCGRYAVLKTARDRESEKIFRDLAGAETAFAIVPRYNASPMQHLPVIAEREGTRRADLMQWWLVPHGSRDGKPLIGKDGTPLKTFNAKAETLETSKLYLPYFRSARCLIPADAFYEWKRLGEREDGKVEKQPMAIRMKDGRPFMFGGLFSKWEGTEGRELLSFTVITTAPNELMSTIHQRMPVIVYEKDHERWLDRTNKAIEGLQEILRPYPAKEMEAFSVSRRVNNSRFDGPECLAPQEQDPALP